MQTIKLEKKDDEWARGRNGDFKPTKIKMIGFGQEGLIFSAESFRSNKVEPILLCLKKQTWAKIIVAIGKELSQ